LFKLIHLVLLFFITGQWE